MVLFDMNYYSDDISNRVEELEELCRRRETPLTIQRRTVFEVAIASPNHPTVDEIFETVRGRIPGISRTTVYRVLDTLFGLGVLGKCAHLGGTLRVDANPRPHHHLVCLHCNEMIDIDAPELSGLSHPDTGDQGFEVIDYSISFRGICSNCRETRSNQLSEAG